ncbi:BTB POZ domain-containing protein [Rutstroemia sp. NJR-2017a BBW]|nr:BTB POZ domain-containing protein [Rutstroemia sp. NJR-2017a BBW]
MPSDAVSDVVWPATMPEVKIVTLDPDGDLIVLLDQMDEDDFQDLSMTGERPTTSEGTPAPFYLVRMVLSSKHMCLASPVFKAMLQGRFKESHQLRENGKVEVPLPDDNAYAFEILARLIHGRFSTVPKQIPIWLLTAIAVLVDKYQLLEIVQLHVANWSSCMPDLEDYSYPSLLDLTQCLCSSYLLRRPVEFKRITRYMCRRNDRSVVAILEEQEELTELLDLPIPQSVFDTVRQESIQKAIAQLYIVISQYASAPLLCPIPKIPDDQGRHFGATVIDRKAACDAMVVGSLIINASQRGLYPQPLPPYDNLSLKEVFQNFINFEVTSACGQLSGKLEDNHGVGERVERNVKAVWDSVNGLELEDLIKDDATLMYRLPMHRAKCSSDFFDR